MSQFGFKMFLFGSDKISCGIEFHVKGAATKKE